MGRALGRYLGDLLDGDPVALIATAVFLGTALLFGLFWWKTARDQRREDEQRKRRRGGQKKG
jgi:hypothetical protein